MKLASSAVNLDGLHQALYFGAGVFAAIHCLLTGKDAVITNAVAGRNYNSFHPKGRALDFRAHLVPQRLRIYLAALVRQLLAPLGFHIVYEPDEIPDEALERQGRKRADIKPHYHLELRDESKWLQKS